MEDAIIVRKEIYDDMGWPLPDTAQEGYDISGFPVCKVVGARIDGRLIIPGRLGVKE